jgi:CO/xanthine dehydrogenase FAD-binding subunit
LREDVLTAFFQPENLTEALAWLGRNTGTIAAGCTDLLAATTAQSLRGNVLDICALTEISGISQQEDGWRIGAGTTWADVARAAFPAAFCGLKQAALQVGSVQIQQVATVGGNLCNASPAADGLVALLVLGAEVELASERGRRRLALADFITGARQTVLAPDEMMLAVHIPQDQASGHSAFVKLGARKYLVISIAMAAARVVLENGKITRCAVAIGACGPVARRLPKVEEMLTGMPVQQAPDCLSDALIGAQIAPIDDIRADSAYRRQAAAEVLRRAFEQAVEAAQCR